MIASKEWVVHERLDDAKPLPRMSKGELINEKDSYIIQTCIL